MKYVEHSYDRVGMGHASHIFFPSAQIPSQFCYSCLSFSLIFNVSVFLFLFRPENSPLAINLYNHNTSGTSFRKLGHVGREHLNSKSRFKKSSKFFSVHWSSETSVFSGSIGNYLFYCQIVQRRKNKQGDEVWDSGLEIVGPF